MSNLPDRIGVRSLLTRLIADGEQVLACRSVPADRLAELLEATVYYLKTPTDTVRCIDAHTHIYAQALERAAYWHANYKPERARAYGRVVAVLIDDLRDDNLKAIEIGRTAPGGP